MEIKQRAGVTTKSIICDHARPSRELCPGTRLINEVRMHAPQFRVSSYCGAGACVAVAPLEDGGVAVRDDKSKDGPWLTFTPTEWTAFVAGVKDGEFDLGTLSST